MNPDDLHEITENEVKEKRLKLAKWFVQNRHIATIDGKDGTAIIRLLYKTGFFPSHGWQSGVFLRDSTRAIVNAIRMSALETPLAPDDIEKVNIDVEYDGDVASVACILEAKDEG